MIGHGYDGAAAFSGRLSGVQKRIRTLAAHALYIHCSCHRLQHASIQTAESVKEVKMMFGVTTNLWKLFYYSPKKVVTLANVQAVLNLPELKVVKPSDTRWLSHERCIAVRKELPALIVTLQQLYESSGDAEAYGLVSILSSITGVSCIYLLSEVLSLLARLNLFMQRKTSDFSKLPIMLSSIVHQLTSLKEPGTDWCIDSDKAISDLEKEHGIAVKTTIGVTRNNFAANSISEFQT